MVQRILKSEFFDRAGIFTSTLCAIHCLSMPIIALFSPVLYATIDNEIVHLFFLMFVLPIGIAAFYMGYKHHKNLKTFMLGTLGLLTVTASIMVHIDWITIIGSVILVYAHFINRRACVCHTHT